MADMDVDTPAQQVEGGEEGNKKTGKEVAKDGKKIRFEVKKVCPLAIALVLVFLCSLC